jgi:zinc transporter, ZIP family
MRERGFRHRDRFGGGSLVAALLFASLAMCSTLAGGYLAIVARRRIHLLMGLGAGVLLGAVFFDLLPESLVVAHDQGWSVRVVLGIVVVGFLLFYLVERLLVLHACAEEDCDNQIHHHVGRFSAIGLIAHSTLDGAAIGAASLVNWRTGLLVALAVIVHDTSDGLNTILLVTRGEQARRSDIIFLVADALAPVAGALLALIILPPPRALVVFLGFASGFFLYTATSDLLPEAHRRSPSIMVAMATVVGILFIGIAVRLIGS